MSVRRVLSASRVLRTGGLKFDGADDYVGTSLAMSVPFTAMAWVNYATFPTGYYTEVLSQGVSASNRSWHLGHVRLTPNQYRVVIYFTDGSSQILFSNFRPNAGEWHHLALVVQLDKTSLYVDGVLDSSITYSGKAVKNTGNIEIGRLAGDVEYFPGLLGEVLIYNRALTQDEILRIYNTGEVIRDGLVLLLDFSEYEGSIAYDKSSLGNHGTIYGAQWVIKKAKRVVSI